MKYAFWSLFAIGFMLCSTIGLGPTLQRVGGDWTAPSIIAGCVLGLALTGLGVAFATGVRPALLPSDVSMLIVLGVLIAAKVAVSLHQAALAAAHA